MYDAEVAFKKALANVSLSQKEDFKDNKMDLNILKACTIPRDAKLTYTEVAKHNNDLTTNNYPMVTLYGFDNYLDLYTWVVSGDTGISKTVKRYGEDLDVLVPVQKDTMKQPLPKKPGKPSDDSQETTTIQDDNYTWGTLGASFGHVDPQIVHAIMSRHPEIIGEGNGDDYVYLNQNGKTIALMAFKVKKNTIDVIGLVELGNNEVANPANNTTKKDDTADLMISNAIIQLGIEKGLDVKFSTDLKENTLLQRLQDSKGTLKIKTLKEDEQ